MRVKVDDSIFVSVVPGPDDTIADFCVRVAGAAESRGAELELCSFWLTAPPGRPLPGVLKVLSVRLKPEENLVVSVRGFGGVWPFTADMVAAPMARTDS